MSNSSHCVLSQAYRKLIYTVVKNVTRYTYNTARRGLPDIYT